MWRTHRANPSCVLRVRPRRSWLRHCQVDDQAIMNGICRRPISACTRWASVTRLDRPPPATGRAGRRTRRSQWTDERLQESGFSRRRMHEWMNEWPNGRWHLDCSESEGPSPELNNTTPDQERYSRRVHRYSSPDCDSCLYNKSTALRLRAEYWIKACISLSTGFHRYRSTRHFAVHAAHYWNTRSNCLPNERERATCAPSSAYYWSL